MSVRGQCQRRAARSASDSLQQAPLYIPVSTQWQQRRCNKLRLPFVRSVNIAWPKPPLLLRTTEPCKVHETSGDGNCLFRCLSLVITGSQRYHNIVRQHIVNHISRNSKVFSAIIPEHVGNGHPQMNACAQYISSSKMANGATWGSDVEILAAAHLLRTRIFVYTLHGPAWQWVEHGLELTDPGRRVCRESIYLMHTGLVHYDLVESIHRSQSDVKDAEQPPRDIKVPVRKQRKKSRNNISNQRNRGCSVPCRAASIHAYRSKTRSSSNSSGSGVSSRSRSSSEGCSSCEESYVSYMSNTSSAVGDTMGQTRRSTVPSRSPRTVQRRGIPANRSYTISH